MHTNVQTTQLKNTLSLLSFVSRPLKKENLYESILLSKRKKEVELLMTSLTLFQTSQYISLLKTVENRFWVHTKSLPEKNQFYSLYFRTGENMVFSQRKKRLKHLTSLTHACNAREHLLKNFKNYPLFKTRFLRLVKKDVLKFSFYGSQGILKSKFKLGKLYKIGKKRGKNKKLPLYQPSYKSWLILNLCLLGILTSLNLMQWTIKIKTFSRQYRIKNRFRKLAYFKSNFNFKSIVSLSSF